MDSFTENLTTSSNSNSNGSMQSNENSSDVLPVLDTNSAIVIFFIFVVLVGIGVVTYYLISYIQDYNKCKSGESIGCPTFYCARLSDGTPGTKCVTEIYNKETQKTEQKNNGNAYRYDETGKVMCQSPTINPERLMNQGPTDCNPGPGKQGVCPDQYYLLG